MASEVGANPRQATAGDEAPETAQAPPGLPPLDLRLLATPRPEYPAFGSHLGAHLAGAAAFRLSGAGHQVGAQVELIFNYRAGEVRGLLWSAPDGGAYRVYADEESTTEEGAIAVAALVSHDVLGYAVVSATAKRDQMDRPSGFDYWLDQDPAAEPLASAARLEVTGIKNDPSRVNPRIGDKLHRLEKYADQRRSLGQEVDPRPVFIVVVEFSNVTVAIHRHDPS